MVRTRRHDRSSECRVSAVPGKCVCVAGFPRSPGAVCVSNKCMGGLRHVSGKCLGQQGCFPGAPMPFPGFLENIQKFQDLIYKDLGLIFKPPREAY